LTYILESRKIKSCPILSIKLLPPKYPSLPGVEGGPATARKARRADSRNPVRKCDADIDFLFNAFLGIPRGETRWGDGRDKAVAAPLTRWPRGTNYDTLPVMLERIQEASR
jgi:hypothetical protein